MKKLPKTTILLPPKYKEENPLKIAFLKTLSSPKLMIWPILNTVSKSFLLITTLILTLFWAMALLPLPQKNTELIWTIAILWGLFAASNLTINTIFTTIFALKAKNTLLYKHRSLANFQNYLPTTYAFHITFSLLSWSLSIIMTALLIAAIMTFIKTNFPIPLKILILSASLALSTFTMLFLTLLKKTSWASLFIDNTSLGTSILQAFKQTTIKFTTFLAIFLMTTLLSILINHINVFSKLLIPNNASSLVFYATLFILIYKLLIDLFELFLYLTFYASTTNKLSPPIPFLPLSKTTPFHFKTTKTKHHTSNKTHRNSSKTVITSNPNNIIKFSDIFKES